MPLQKPGWAYFEEAKLLNYGLLEVEIKDFNVNDFPNKSPLYPFNIIDAAHNMTAQIFQIIDKYNPDSIVIERDS